MTTEPNEQIPEPYYTLIDTLRGSNAAIVVVNSALRKFQHRGRFPWHLSIEICCQLLGDQGMPTREENQVLYKLEDEISDHLSINGNAVFLSRVTCQGKRELAYRIHDPKTANARLSQLVSAPDQLREWEYRIEHDHDWALAGPVLDLLESSSQFN